MGQIFAVVCIGWSQIFFNLILYNRAHFPMNGLFYLWTWVWIQAVPFGLLFGADSLIRRWKGEARLFRIWRTTLYVGALLSFLRQVQVILSGNPVGSPGPVVIVATYVALAGLSVFLCTWRHRQAGRYAALMGLLALLLTGIYVARTGLLGPAWSVREIRELPTEQAGDGPPVYLIVFDELAHEILLKDGVIDAEAFPNFARLASRGLWFRKAITNYGYTSRALPCMFTGKFMTPTPSRTLFERIPASTPVLLIENSMRIFNWIQGRVDPRRTLAYRGEIVVIVRGPLVTARFLLQAFLHSPFSESPLARSGTIGMEAPVFWLDPHLPRHSRSDIDALLEATDARASPGRFVYWHSRFPHAPFQYDRNGRKHNRPTTLSQNPDPAALRDGVSWNDLIWENYHEQVRWVDTLLGRFLDRLDREGLTDKAVVLVTTDHGLRTWAERRLQPEGYPRVMNDLTPAIPFFILGPGIEPGVSDEDVQTIDVTPTLLDLMGVPYDPAEFDGRSVFSRERPARRRIFHFRDKTYFPDPDTSLWRLDD